jgi:hypothetical protein
MGLVSFCFTKPESVELFEFWERYLWSLTRGIYWSWCHKNHWDSVKRLHFDGSFRRVVYPKLKLIRCFQYACSGIYTRLDSVEYALSYHFWGKHLSNFGFEVNYPFKKNVQVSLSFESFGESEHGIQKRGQVQGRITVIKKLLEYSMHISEDTLVSSVKHWGQHPSLE